MAKREASRNAVILLFAAAIVISGVGMAFVAGRAGFPITGYQTGSANATVQFTIQQVASLRFAIDTVNFGTGFVNTSGGNTVCILDTNGTNDPARCRNFTTVTQGLVLENDGLVNLTVSLVSNKNDTAFIGGNDTLNAFTWRVAQNESNSCGNLTGPTSFVDVNTTSPGTLICNIFSGNFGGFNFQDDRDTLLIDVNISIPYDATAGPKNATLTATGTAV